MYLFSMFSFGNFRWREVKIMDRRTWTCDPNWGSGNCCHVGFLVQTKKKGKDPICPFFPFVGLTIPILCSTVPVLGKSLNTNRFFHFWTGEKKGNRFEFGEFGIEFEIGIGQFEFEIGRKNSCPNFEKFRFQTSDLPNSISMHSPRSRNWTFIFLVANIKS